MPREIAAARIRQGWSFRAAFVIIAAAVVLHLAIWKTLVFFFGYFICAYFDQRTFQKAKDEVFEAIMLDWKVDPEDPEWETHGGLTRRRLDDEQQIVVTRVAELLRRMPGIN